MKHNRPRLEQPFVFMVGIAALIHSTWTIATFSGGEAPAVSAENPISYAQWLWWVLPGFLAAFALEVGQVDTARKIAHGVGRRFKVWILTINVKVITFVILSAATYLLQLTYLLHHFPERSVSSGLSLTSQQAAQTVMELIVWLSPLLLPLSMWMSVAGDEHSLRSNIDQVDHSGNKSEQAPQLPATAERALESAEQPFLTVFGANGKSRASSDVTN